MPGSEVCVSWDFDLQGWSRRGCKTTVGENGTVMCACNHLTNFAVLVVREISGINISLSLNHLILPLITGHMFQAGRLSAYQPSG